ncbi:hypothetical protein BX070DRAFT_13768 [Coemansia spiralis]|nr:hypothetical protein BX070DRAFT_13768 [Coemansia spiralis]
MTGTGLELLLMRSTWMAANARSLRVVSKQWLSPIRAFIWREAGFGKNARGVAWYLGADTAGLFFLLVIYRGNGCGKEIIRLLFSFFFSFLQMIITARWAHAYRRL